MVVPVMQRIRIKRLAINALDLNSSEPKISNTLFPLGTGNEIIDSFFQTHFTETREGKSTKSCKFIDSDATVKTKITRYYENKSDENFLKLSKELTENLFKIMKNSSSTSSGTFFVIEIEKNDEECIFIIKLDPKHGVQINFENLTVSVLENILPDSNDRVHKCAIINYTKPENSKAGLFVMDKQQKEGEPAKFFIETYLQAEELLNDKIITKEVIRSAKEKIMQILPSAEQNQISEAIDKVFSNGARIQLKTSIKNVLEDIVPKDHTNREIFIDTSATGFVSEYLEKYPDHQTSFVAERKDNAVIYRGEKDQIFFRYNKGIMSQISVKLDDTGNTLIKIDKSLNFKRDLK
ncbi:nucleoid-associated protein [Bacillus wiedmannii]|uniref:nucleoid-associated protein n=1 Tax=Bacillus wiedmannii TaxID=1890302 RepID=UPI00339AD0C9